MAAGYRSMLMRRVGGASAPAPVSIPGYRSILGRRFGGASAPAVAPVPGYRSLRARWLGGASSGTFVEPPTPAPVPAQGGRRFPVPGDLQAARRRKLIDEDELLILMAAQIAASGLLH